MTTFYVASNGQPTGPYTIQQLKQLNISKETLVWNKTMTNWTPAGKIAELQPLFATPQSYCQQSQSQNCRQEKQQCCSNGVPEQRLVGFMEAIRRGLTNYCCFSGRASRSEFWFFQLFICIVNSVTYSFVFLLATIADSSIPLALSYLVYLGLFLPHLGLAWRRMHDVGHCGGYIFMGLIPLVGWIFVLIACCKESEPFENDYGPVPNVD